MAASRSVPPCTGGAIGVRSRGTARARRIQDPDGPRDARDGAHRPSADDAGGTPDGESIAAAAEGASPRRLGAAGA
ncbi:MAG: hypothetical protein ACHQ01_11275, partial [Candidatus Limnocylindrales bacterium]